MVLMHPPASQAELDEFNDITYDKIKSWTSIPKLKRLEKYMRDEGFYQTADVIRKRIIELGGLDPDNVDTCLSSRETDDMVKVLQFWQADIKEKDLELQKLRNLKPKMDSDDLDSDLPKVRKMNPESKKKIKEDSDTKLISNEHKQIKTTEKDIRSGGEYYQGWDKYVSNWEKENSEAKDNEPVDIHKQDEITQRKNKQITKEKPLVERMWLANREKEKGNDLFKAKEYNASLQAYTKAINAYRSSPIIYANRAAVYLKMNRFEEAYADCNEALKHDPQNVKALLRRGKASLEMGEPSKALQDINEVLKFDGTNDEVLRLKRKAEDLLKKQDTYSPVKSHEESSLEMDEPMVSKDEEIMCFGSNVEDTSDKQNAECSLPTSSGSQKVLIEEVKEISETDEKQKQFVNHESKQNNKGTTSNSGTHQREHRGNTDQGTLLGSRRFVIEEVEGMSEAEGKQMETMNLNDCKATDQKRNLELGHKANNGTHQRNNKDQEDQKEMSDYWHTKGNKFFKERNFEKAYDCYTKCLSYGPENVLILSNRALCQLKLKNYINAEKDASSAIALDPECVKAFHHRALARHALLKLEEGIQDLQKVMNAFPGDERLISELKKMEADLNNQGYLPKRQGPMLIEEIPYVDSGNPSSSNVKALQEAEHFHGLCREIEIRTHTSQAQCVEEPLTAEEQRVRGNQLFSNGHYEAAIDLYSKSIELDSSVAATYTNRALCYLKLNDPEKAIADCDHAIMLEPDNKKAYYRRAISKQQIQDLCGALEDFQIVMKLSPNDHTVEENIQMIEKKLCQYTDDEDAHEDVAKNCRMNKLVGNSKLQTPDISRTLENKAMRIAREIPKTAIEFERALLELSKEPEHLKKYILNIRTSLYPAIFKEDLSARILKLVGCYLKENLALFKSEEVEAILEAFASVKRFQIALMLLPRCDREVFKRLFESMDEVSSKGDRLRSMYQAN